MNFFKSDHGKIAHRAEDKLQEKCGLFSIISPHPIPVSDFFLGWAAIQGRGQDAAGFVNFQRDKGITEFKRSGSIKELFSSIDSKELSAVTSAIGHNRYATSEGLTLDNIQPFVFTSKKHSLVLAHNGNVPDECVKNIYSQLTSPLLEGSSDSAVMTAFLIQEREKYSSWKETFIHTLPKFEGAFSLIMMTEDGTVYATKDPWGIRPLALGRKGLATVIASESVCFEHLGADYVRELEPGELCIFPPDGTTQSVLYGRSQHNFPCSLEVHYFAQPESFYDGQTIRNQRLALGKHVAKRFKEKGIQADCVVPILKSGYEVAYGFAVEVDLPLMMAIKKNPRSSRSFIQSTTQKRQAAIYDKHLIDPHILGGKNIILCDDSVVRGNSLGILITKIRNLKEKGPRAIHVVLGSPPVIDVCDLGVAISEHKELLVAQWKDLSLPEIEQMVAKSINVDSVTFSTHRIVEEALEKKSDDLCYRCFGGSHPVRDRRTPGFRTFLEPKLHHQKIAFISSGQSWWIEDILHSTQQAEILAQPLKILMFNKNGKERKEMETLHFPIVHLKKDKEKKLLVPKEVIQIYFEKENTPDVIIVDWKVELSAEFLQIAFEKGVDIILLHPTLITGKQSEKVMSSKGLMPQIVGPTSVKAVHQKSHLEMPVTGCTVYRLTKNGMRDILVKREIVREEKETLKSLTLRIEESIQEILSLAVQKALLMRTIRETGALS